MGRKKKKATKPWCWYPLQILMVFLRVNVAQVEMVNDDARPSRPAGFVKILGLEVFICLFFVACGIYL